MRRQSQPPPKELPLHLHPQCHRVTQSIDLLSFIEGKLEIIQNWGLQKRHNDQFFFPMPPVDAPVSKLPPLRVLRITERSDITEGIFLSVE